MLNSIKIRFFFFLPDLQIYSGQSNFKILVRRLLSISFFNFSRFKFLFIIIISLFLSLIHKLSFVLLCSVIDLNENQLKLLII